MGKLLAAGGVVLVVLAVVLLHLMKGSTEVDAAPPAPVVAAPPPAPPPAAPHILAPQPKTDEVPVDVKPGQVSPYSREWQAAFDDPHPKRLYRDAAKCYTGGLNRVDRNAKLKLTFRDRIVNGDVTVYDVKVVDDTLNNKALSDCFIARVKAFKWHSDALPNWDQEDMLLIRPERGMKKYLPESLNYEGDGPEFPGGKAVMPTPQKEPPVGGGETE